MGDNVVGNVPDDCLQVVVVYANEFTDKEGVVCCYQRDDSDSAWVRRAGADNEEHSIAAVLGSEGIGLALDDSEQTPVGSFPLTQAFGRYEMPDVKMDYFTLTDQDLWDEGHEEWMDAFGQGKPTTYNTHITRDQDWGQETEELYDFPAYTYAVLVDHNPTRRPGLGCAIFLHCQDTSMKTEGCIAVDETIMKWILLWLDPDRHPYLSVLVGVPDPE